VIELNTNKVRLSLPPQSDSIVDGEGLRTVIWFQGCPHNCLGCHNKDTQNFKGGKVVPIEEMISLLANLDFQDGLTFSGGEPFAQPEALAVLAREAKRLNLNVWSYTGYTYEELIVLSKQNAYILEALKNIDVLVDGRFKLEEKSLNVKFRGSKNQRIINVPKSLKQGRAVLVQKYRKEKEITVAYQEQFV